MQKNWIGKSLGCELSFKIKGNKDINEIKCFTTRPDTLFGMSFLAVSVDHPISEFYKNDKSLKNLNQIAQKLEQQKSLLRKLRNLVLKQIYQQLTQ